MKYVTVATVKIDVVCEAVDSEDAAEINEYYLKDKLAEVMASPFVDGINIIHSHTTKLKKES